MGLARAHKLSKIIRLEEATAEIFGETYGILKHIKEYNWSSVWFGVIVSIKYIKVSAAEKNVYLKLKIIHIIFFLGP